MSFLDRFKHKDEQEKETVKLLPRLPYPEIFEQDNNVKLNKIIISGSSDFKFPEHLKNEITFYYTINNTDYKFVLLTSVTDHTPIVITSLDTTTYLEQDNSLISVDTVDKRLHAYQLVKPTLDNFITHLKSNGVMNTFYFQKVLTEHDNEVDKSNIIIDDTGYTFNGKKLISVNNGKLKITSEVVNYIIIKSEYNPITVFARLFKNDEIDKLLANK